MKVMKSPNWTKHVIGVNKKLWVMRTNEGFDWMVATPKDVSTQLQMLMLLPDSGDANVNMN